VKRRTSREISVFNLSMLDVIFSALGAILILYILVIENTSKAEEQAKQAQSQVQMQTQKIKRMQDDFERLAKKYAKEIGKLSKELQDALKKLKRKARRGKGMSMGMCQVKVATVRLSFWDHGQEDRDRVKLKWNEKILRRNMELFSQHRKKGLFTVNVDVGSNYLIVNALTQGDVGDNTATIKVTPCRDGKPQDFVWDMKTGETRNLSIDRN
jgi:Skp family chaperone for outer membrane proteins